MLGDQVFHEVTSPRTVAGQRASALPYGNMLVMALFHVLLLFRLLPCGFRNKELREHLARLLGHDPEKYTQGQMTYQLRRLRLHGLIERQPATHSYRVTDRGLRIALFFTRSYARLVSPGIAQTIALLPADTDVQRAFARVEQALDRYASKQRC